MVLTDKLWDDVIAGPQPDKGPDKGPGKLRKLSTKNMEMKDGEGSSKYQRSMVMPGTRSTPTTTASPSTPSSARENAWKGYFNLGSNLATKKVGGTRSTPTATASPSTPSSARENAWRSDFNPGSNLATKKLGAQLFDNPQPCSPTVYDWVFNGETKSTRR